MPSVPTVYDTKQAEIRCLSLFNGTDNDAPPAGWRTAGFDDSGWSFSANPNVVSSRRLSPGVPANGVFPTAGTEAIWPTTSPTNAKQYAIFRWPVVFGGVPDFITLSMYAATSASYGSGPAPPFGAALQLWTNNVYTDSSVWQNPTFSTSFFNTNIHIGTNIFSFLLAYEPFSGGGFSPDTGGGLQPTVWFGAGDAWFAMRMTIGILALGRGFAQVVG